MAMDRGNDALLGLTRLLLRLCIGLIALTLLIGSVAVIALIVFPDQKLLPGLSVPEVRWWVVAGAVVGLMMVALYLPFTLNLLRIIDTVGTGDPFRPENADRLQTMGWLTLGVQICMLVSAPIVNEIARRIDQFEGEFDVALSGFILALVLFVLARVFRHGTSLRDDLEGTV